MYVTSPSWSIPGKYDKTKVSQSPSPCGYHPQKSQKWTVDHSPSWKIGTSVRNKQNLHMKLVPGPGQYQPHKQNSKSKPKLGVFNHQVYHKVQVNENPSPGSYTPNYKLNRPASPSVTISSKINHDKQNNVPGPGVYQVNANAKYSPVNVKIGGQKRFVTEKAFGPGPQAYAPTNNNFKKVSVGFTKSDKNSMSFTQNKAVPGPGQYATIDIFQASLKQKRGYSISSKHKSNKPNQNPGPGQYNPTFNGTLLKSPYVSMKGKHYSDKIQKTPGPSQYFMDNNYKNRNQQSGYSIGKGSRATINYFVSNPGPGAYNPKSLCTDTPKYSLYGSRIHQPKQSSPGPGAYNADKNILKKRPQSAKIGNSKRGINEKSISPGPGAYQNKPRPSTPCSTFTRQQRNKQSMQISPGPADYLISPLLGTTQSYVTKS